jgi:hypothetical protein
VNRGPPGGQVVGDGGTPHRKAVRTSHGRDDSTTPAHSTARVKDTYKMYYVNSPRWINVEKSNCSTTGPAETVCPVSTSTGDLDRFLMQVQRPSLSVEAAERSSSNCRVRCRLSFTVVSAGRRSRRRPGSRLAETALEHDARFTRKCWLPASLGLGHPHRECSPGSGL